VLIGKVITTAGMHAPWSFLIVSLIAGFTGEWIQRAALIICCRIHCVGNVSGLPVSSRNYRIKKGDIPRYAAIFDPGD